MEIERKAIPSLAQIQPTSESAKKTENGRVYDHVSNPALLTLRLGCNVISSTGALLA